MPLVTWNRYLRVGASRVDDLGVGLASALLLHRAVHLLRLVVISVLLQRQVLVRAARQILVITNKKIKRKLQLFFFKFFKKLM